MAALSVDAASSRSESKQNSQGRWRFDLPRLNWAVGMGTAVLLIVSMLLAAQIRFGGDRDAQIKPAAGPDLAQTSSLPDTTEFINPQKLLGLTLLLDQPLERELNNVASDARTAVLLLADNFLPEKTVALFRPVP
jgi:hypothetical protein